MAAPDPSAVADGRRRPAQRGPPRGRVSGLPETRELPSGDTVVLVRLVVRGWRRRARPDGTGGAGRRHPRLRGLAGRPASPGRLVGRR